MKASKDGEICSGPKACYLEQDILAQTGKAIIPYNQGASEVRAHGISVPGLRLCFSALTLSPSSSELWTAAGDTAVSGARARQDRKPRGRQDLPSLCRICISAHAHGVWQKVSTRC